MEVIHWQGPLLLITIALVLVVVATLLSHAMDLVPSLLRACGLRRGGRQRVRLCSSPSPLQAAEVQEDDSRGWSEHLRRVDAALAAGDGEAAARSWLAAMRSARTEARWEGLLAVGAARIKVAEFTNGRKEAEAKARELFLLALFHARKQASVVGLLRCAESLAALGDYQLADQALRIAEVFAEAPDDVNALTQLRQIIRRLPSVPPGNTTLHALC
jgi:hypothetical protein